MSTHRLFPVMFTLSWLFFALPSATAQTVAEIKQEAKEEARGFTTPRVSLSAKMYEVKHRDVIQLAEALRGLVGPGGQIISNAEFKTITVRDAPENLAAIESALLKLDVPKSFTPPVNLEVRLHLLATSDTPTEKGKFPTKLEPVLAQLQDTLKYPGYRFVTTFVNRTKAGGGVEANSLSGPLFLASGSAKEATTSYRYALVGIKLVTDADGKELIVIDKFRFSINALLPGIGYRDIGLDTTQLGLREGEMVVVGTSNFGDEAVIVVVSVAKLR